MIANNNNRAAQLEVEMKREFNLRSTTLKEKTEIFKSALGYIPDPGSMTPDEMSTVVDYLKEDRDAY